MRSHAWEHGESEVWELRSASGPAFLKRHRQRVKFEQECRAYLEWLSQLPPVTPRLLARDPALQAVLLSALPGVPLERLALDSGREQAHYRRAGAFLRALHALPCPTAHTSVCAQVLQRLEAWEPRARGLLSAAELEFVRVRVRNLAGLEFPPAVPCHRDYSPRNWLVPPGGAPELWVIDFEHARPELALQDLIRLRSREWVGRPDLEAAFFEGYGRDLSDLERFVMEALEALQALTTVVWAREHADVAFEAFGRAWLERLRR
nr:aminoglycoside phosphotransferase family protein [Deinobacterium chartae]